MIDPETARQFNEKQGYIKEITHEGHQVVIYKVNERGRRVKEQISIRDAILRAKAGLEAADPLDTKPTYEIIEALLCAANEAKKVRDGVGFSSRWLDALRASYKSKLDQNTDLLSS